MFTVPRRVRFGGKRLTVMVIPHSEEATFSFRVPLLVVQLVFLFLAFALISGLGFAGAYYRLRGRMPELDQLRLVNREQKQQIDVLTDEARLLHEDMQRLNELERQIREMMKLNRESRPAVQTPVVAQTGGTREGPSPAPTRITLVRAASVSQSYGDVLRTLVDWQKLRQAIELESSLGQVKEEMHQAQGRLEELRATIAEHLAYLAARPSIPPVAGMVTSRFGPRASPFGAGIQFHQGVDLATVYGSPVVATGDGRVSFAGWRGAYGKAIQLEHGYGFTTLYAHLSKLVVKVDDQVRKGQVIGYVGKSGRTTGPHLHYEVRVNGQPVNPLPYMR